MEEKRGRETATGKGSVGPTCESPATVSAGLSIDYDRDYLN